MRASHFGAVWIAVLAIAVAVIAGLIMTAPAKDTVYDIYSFSDVDIAVVGSSLSKSAFAPTGSGSQSIFADGRSHRRVGLASPPPELIEDVLEIAVKEQVPLVLLELRPFIFVTKDQIPCDRLRCRLLELMPDIFALRWEFRERYRQLSGLPPSTNMLTSAISEYPLLETTEQSPSRLASRYPLTFLDAKPSVRLLSLVTKAKRNGTRIVLLMPPRLNTVYEYIGEQQTRELQQRSARFAEALDLDLFMPGGIWGRDMFVDTAHMRRGGRARFQEELRSWWERQP